MLPGSRSWTDTTTNSIFFRGLDSSAYLRWLSRRDLGEAHLVGQFLHEFTHHWCYRTLLGATLALIELRLSIFIEAYPDGRSVWARDLLAYRTINNLLRPISEGLSQTAEYDLTDISGDAHPGTPFWASVLAFGATHNHMLDDVFRHRMVQALRHSADLLDRKASLYLKNFEVEEGYLSGYMAVKNVAWSIVGRGYNVPVELFLAYMRSYFWDDPELINVIVSEEMDGSKVASSLHRRFIDRFMALLTAKDLPERMQSFWRKWAPDTLVPAHCADELGCEEQQFVVAKNKIDLLEQDFHRLVERNRAAVEHVTRMRFNDVHGLMEIIADSRRYVTVAAARLEVRADGEIALGGGGEGVVPAPELSEYVELPPGGYEISAVIPTFGTFLAILSLDQQGHVTPLAEYQAPGIDDGIRQSTLRFVRNREALRATMQGLRERFLKTGVKVVASKVLDELSTWSREEAVRIYAIVACARIQDLEKARAAREALRSDGLKPLFARDPVAARLVAGMSMLSSTDQVLHQNSDALVHFAQLYYLRDSKEEDLRKRRDALLARDVDRLVLHQVNDVLFVYV